MSGRVIMVVLLTSVLATLYVWLFARAAARLGVRQKQDRRFHAAGQLRMLTASVTAAVIFTLLFFVWAFRL